MMGWRRRAAGLVSEESGFALLLALGAMIVLTIMATSMFLYTSQSSRSSASFSGQLSANQMAEGALNNAYTVLNNWDSASNTGTNAADPTVLGCNAGSGGSSGTTCSPTCVSIAATCPNASTAGMAGTGTYVGSYDAPTGTWTITGVGYARNPNGAPLMKSMQATVKIVADPNNPANVAAWNNIYSTAPQGAGCEFNITNDHVYLDVPIYVTGDMCLSGNYDRVWEQSGGQPVDLRVQGKLVIANGSSVGWNDTYNNKIYPITSGVVGQGCATTFTATPTPCNSTSYNYWVRSTGTLTALTPPTADGTGWYNQANPGPKHPCAAGSSPPPLPSSVFDNDTTYNNSVATPFNLTPTTSYSCLGSGGGQLSWDASNKKLTIAGTVFIDGSVNVTQSGTYTGIGTLYVGGSYAFTGANVVLCAVQYCGFSSWNPNTTMLMVVALGPGNAVSMTGNADIFQGGLFTNPASTISFTGSNTWVQGPLVGGKFVFSQNTIVNPLPYINKLPPGAPLAVNARATPQTPVIISG